MGQYADVVVVGAGASGLQLAGSLHKAGISVAVLEASNHIGGRLLTVDPGVDLGATWFWQNEQDVLDLISEFKLETFPQFTTGNAMYHGPGGVQELDGNPLDQRAWRIVGGMGKVVEALNSFLPAGMVKLGSKVNKISFQDQVKISTNSGEWLAKKVVLALPPVTALCNITFDPPLSASLINIASKMPVWMGSVRKVVAIYETPFWRVNGLAGSAISHIGPLREIHDVSSSSATFGALFGFSPGPVSKSEAIDQFVQIFGIQAKDPKNLLIQDWSTSEFISPPNVGDLTNYQLFGSKEVQSSYFDDRLYFSSTETANDSAGHVQGALSAARRTADLILSSGFSQG